MPTTIFLFDDLFQAQVIKLLISDIVFLLNFVEAIKPEYFTTAIDSAIFSNIQTFYKEHRKAPIIEELANCLKNHKVDLEYVKAYVSRLKYIKDIDISTPDHVRNEVRNFCKRQELITGVHKVIDLIDKTKLDDDKIRAVINDALEVGNTQIDLYDYFEKHEQRLLSPVRETLPTLIKNLDSYLKGGLAIGELGLLVGSPKRGKTTLLINIGASAVYMGKFVVYYSLEMSEDRIGEKFDSRFSGIPDHNLNSQHKDVSDRLDKIKAKGSNLTLRTFPAGSLTVAKLKNDLDYLIVRIGRKPDLVIIDYLTIMKPPSGGDVERWVQLITEVRGVAQLFNTRIWTAAQANRGGTDKDTLEMEDISKAFEMFAVADVAISINQNFNEKKQDMARLFIVASRVGPDKVEVPISIKRDVVLVSNLDQVVATVDEPKPADPALPRMIGPRP